MSGKARGKEGLRSLCNGVKASEPGKSIDGRGRPLARSLARLFVLESELGTGPVPSMRIHVYWLDLDEEKDGRTDCRAASLVLLLASSSTARVSETRVVRIFV